MTRSGAIDVGIVTTSPEAMIRFYRDALGLSPAGPLPTSGGSTVEQFTWGDSVLKIVTLTAPPAQRGVPGGIPGATGYRFITLTVTDLEGVISRCSAAGAPLVVPVTPIAGGPTVAIVADPDGNWVELMRSGEPTG